VGRTGHGQQRALHNARSLPMPAVGPRTERGLLSRLMRPAHLVLCVAGRAGYPARLLDCHCDVVVDVADQAKLRAQPIRKTAH
jgi:hypothetical protein